MKTDFYTRAVLTVIAGCLLWICVKDAVFDNPVAAQNGQPVYITGFNLPAPLPVQINAVNRNYGGKWDALEVAASQYPLQVVTLNAPPTPKPAPTATPRPSPE